MCNKKIDLNDNCFELIKRIMNSHSIIDVNFNNHSHMNAIIELSKKNNFHFGDICVACDDVDNALKSIIEVAKKRKLTIRNKMKPEIVKNFRQKAYKLNSNYKGIIITNTSGKKAVGFILYHENCIQPPHNRVDIHFLLIDKKYQNMGLGTRLIDVVKHKYEESLIVIRSDNDYSNRFYIRNDFLEFDKFMNKFISKYPNSKTEKTRFVGLSMMSDVMNQVRQTKLYFINDN